MFTRARWIVWIIVLMTGLVGLGFSNVAAYGQEVVYYAPAPLVAPAPVVTYYAPPIVAYSVPPVVTYSEVTIYRYSPVVPSYSPVVPYYGTAVIVSPRVFVPGEPVRNFLRAILP